LACRVRDYDPQWLDNLCLTGRIGWGRLFPRRTISEHTSATGPTRVTRISLFRRDHRNLWIDFEIDDNNNVEFSYYTKTVMESIRQHGALFVQEIVERTRLLRSQVEEALAELATMGWVTSDSFSGLRTFLLPAHKRHPDRRRRRRQSTTLGLESAGRWSLLRMPRSI
jgi:ATP-dependent Lhr-like helicase